MRRIAALALMLSVAAAQPAYAWQPSLESGSVLEAAERLRPGEFLWAPAVAPEGPVMLVVSLATQRAILYRNGLPIAISTVSTGRLGHRTPSGVFTVLQRNVEHYSSIYNNAPMPFMQRLTWGGVALHGGHLPGYPASHGCIRLPHEFARLLYGVTRLGMTVVVTRDSAVPRIAPSDPLVEGQAGGGDGVSWHPERARSGPVSIVISQRDQRLVVLRNGVQIGAAPARLDGPLARTSVYVLQGSAADRRNWLRVALPGQAPDPGNELAGRIHVADDFRQLVMPILEPGTTVVITQDSLRRSNAMRPVTVIEDDRAH